MTTQGLRELLARNVSLTKRAKAHDGRIADAARQELDSVNKRLALIPAGIAVLNPAKAEEYRRLVMDRARLHQLLGQNQAPSKENPS